MKVLVISNTYPPYYMGGYELECRDVVETLRGRGHDVTVLTSLHGVKAPQVDGHVHRRLRLLHDEVPPQTFSTKISPVGYAKAELRVNAVSRFNRGVTARFVRDLKPDVVYVWNLSGLTQSVLNPVFDEKLPRLYRLGDRWVIHYLDYFRSNNPVRRAARRWLTGLDVGRFRSEPGTLLVNSEMMRQEHIAAGIPAERLEVLYLGIEVPDEIAPPPPVDDTFRLLYVGRICEDKGVDVAVKTVEILAKQGGPLRYTLDIIGAGPDDYAVGLKQYCNDRGLTGNTVRFLGVLPQEELAAVRPNYHALLFPSVWAEPFGLVNIEAMAVGVPVIGTRVGGAAEVLSDGVNCLAFPPGDQEALAEAITRLSVDRELREKLIRGGRETVLSRFRYEQVAERHVEYLERTVAEWGKQPTGPVS